MTITIQGLRKVGMQIEILRIEGSRVEVRQTMTIEGEMYRECDHWMWPGDRLVQDYSMEVDQPLTAADRRAIEREREKK